jgi:hypothetical protein
MVPTVLLLLEETKTDREKSKLLLLLRHAASDFSLGSSVFFFLQTKLPEMQLVGASATKALLMTLTLIAINLTHLLLQQVEDLLNAD